MKDYDGSYTDKNADIRDIITEDENLIWSGKPYKKRFIIGKVLRMLPVALIWIAFDGFFIFQLLSSGFEGSMNGFMTGFIFVFFLFHLMPVWIWLSGIITASRRWKKTTYAVTDKRIIIITGLVGFAYDSLFYKDIQSVRLNVDFIDKFFNVGDIHFMSPSGNRSFLDIKDYAKIYKEVQRTVNDIQTDIQFPNAYRPDNNPGYHTSYNPYKK